MGERRGIILRHDLDDDPHVLGICETLEIDVDTCLAKLRRIWRHADLHADDGWIPYANAKLVDKIVDLAGFASAMAKVGWLCFHLAGVQIPDFAEYMSEKGIRRVMGLEEEKKHREAGDWPGFEDFWKLYPRKKSKGHALRAWNALRPDESLVARIHRGVHRDIASEQWRRDDGKFIPYPATWIRGRRWEDDPESGSSLGRPGRVYGEPGKYASLGQGGEARPAGDGQAGLFAAQDPVGGEDPPGPQATDQYPGGW